MKYTFIIFYLFLYVLPAGSAIADYYDDSLTPEEFEQLQQKAEKGDTEAEFNLAEAYHKGDGVAQDDQTATRWYLKAAEEGNQEAQYALGFIYRGGNGVPMDPVRSYMWFDIAVNGGYDKAIELRRDVADSMTDDEIDQARTLSKEWRKEHHQ